MEFGTNLLEAFQPQFIALYTLVAILGLVILAIKRSATGLIAFVILMSIIGALIAGPSTLITLGKKLVAVVFG